MESGCPRFEVNNWHVILPPAICLWHSTLGHTKRGAELSTGFMIYILTCTLCHDQKDMHTGYKQWSGHSLWEKMRSFFSQEEFCLALLLIHKNLHFQLSWSNFTSCHPLWSPDKAKLYIHTSLWYSCFPSTLDLNTNFGGATILAMCLWLCTVCF